MTKHGLEAGALKIQFSSSYDHLYIWSIGFDGRYWKSSNGEYIIALQDSDYRGDEGGGFRKSGHGRCLLLKNSHLIYQVDKQRPIKGAVSNNGIGAIHDIGFGESPKGVFYVLNPEGKPIIEYPITASNPNPGILERGEIAWLSTGNELLFFSLPQSRLLFKLTENKPPEKVEIVGNQMQVTLRAIIRKYDTSGVILNGDDVSKAETKWLLDNGDSFSLEANAAGLLEKLKQDNSHPRALKTEIEMMLETALKRAKDDFQRAIIHRRLGETAEAVGSRDIAMSQYREALRYDPKVGVKKALARVEKLQAGNKK